MRVCLTILVCLLGIIISIYDIKFREVPVFILVSHFISIIIYISLYSVVTSIILLLTGLILLLVCIIKNFVVDWLYVGLICIGFIILKSATLLTNIMLLPIIVCVLIVICSRSQKFPYLTCLTTIISLTILQLL